jgi:hypothetical protein
MMWFVRIFICGVLVKLIFSCFLSINASNFKWRFVCGDSHTVQYKLISLDLNLKICLLYSRPEVVSSKTFVRDFWDFSLASTTKTPKSQFLVNFVYFYILWSEKSELGAIFWCCLLIWQQHWTHESFSSKQNKMSNMESFGFICQLSLRCPNNI